jgi:two-component system, NarL family, invasion response regulator UvrY
MRKTISVIVADDHPIILAGYRHLLEDAEDIKIIDLQRTAQGAIDACLRTPPDVLILDLGLPVNDSADAKTHSLSGLDVVNQLIQKSCTSRILVATMLDKAPVPQRVMKAGASGYLVKSEVADELLTAIRTVASGASYISPSIAEELEYKTNPTAGISDLSKREVDIFLLLSEGLPAVKIAEMTHLSPKTVHAHRANILRKLNLKNNSELVRFALGSGLIQR